MGIDFAKSSILEAINTIMRYLNKGTCLSYGLQ